MTDAKHRHARRRAILAGVALVIALALFFSEADENSWLGRQLGRASGDPFEGLVTLPTPTAHGMIVCLPPALGTAGAVLAPRFKLQLAPGVVVDECRALIYRDRNGDLLPDADEVFLDDTVGLLPREDGTYEPDGWSLRVPLEQDAGELSFRVSLWIGGEVLSWQGEVVAAEPHDARL